MEITRLVRMFVITAFLMAGIVSVSMAQEAEDLDFAYGKVSRVEGDTIYLMVYDYEMDQEIEVAYDVNTETVYEGVASAADLMGGDEADVEYVEMNGKKVVKNLFKTVSSAIEETTGEVIEETAGEVMEAPAEEVMEEPATIEIDE
ncbi:MAG: hypothetical protein JW847_07490 [Candidatus Omnitrophica bacterium]|nr:hypothetical protein [Candidatus Omnitrophota bacterium]